MVAVHALRANSEPHPHGAVSAAPRVHHSLTSRSAYTVVPGDTLWGIAAAQLPAGASAARINEQVHRLWTLNAARIGTGDPDLLLPGQHLALP